MSLLEQELTSYRGYTLDPFQREAIQALAAGDSVLVSAPTGTGKTLIADYLTELSFKRDRHIVYTAPIKALSNQKFKEFKALLGEEHVGILTGDVVVNPGAPVLIMTTEIFRNLLHADRARLASVSHVIFDEVHYIDDPMRGSVWEESLIFMPSDMRFLGLSATIPNVDELARWIQSIQGRPVRVITHAERAVPLEHRLFEQALGECTKKQLERRYKRYAARFGVTSSGYVAASFESTRHVDLVKHIVPDLLPTLFFAFSRRKCESYAYELALTQAFLDRAEQEEVRRVIAHALERYNGAGQRSVKAAEHLFMKGIAFHHAGLLPVMKDIVEELFERRLVKVLYCTETFAVGLNFPCKTVCFDAMTKWDGTRFRALTNREYFQMAGRAGRRGIDAHGFVYSMVDFNFYNPKEFPTMREDDVEPISSRFTLTYNSVLNLVKNYERREIESILRRNFASYQAQGARAGYQRELDQLTEELRGLLGDLTVDDAERLLKLFEVEQRLNRIEQRRARRHGAGGRPWGASAKEARNLKRELARLQEHELSDEQVEAFRARAGAYRRVEARLSALQRTLYALPGEDSFIKEFEEKRALLEAMDYIRDESLTARGEFAAQIHGNELLVTELFFRGLFHDWDEDEVNALAASMEHEPRKGEERTQHKAFELGPVKRALQLIEKMERAYLGHSPTVFNDHLAMAAKVWSEGATFGEAVAQAGVDEGDLVFGFRRAIDVLRQVRQAAKGDEALGAKLSKCIEKMDRDEVAILL